MQDVTLCVLVANLVANLVDRYPQEVELLDLAVAAADYRQSSRQGSRQGFRRGGQAATRGWSRSCLRSF